MCIILIKYDVKLKEYKTKSPIEDAPMCTLNFCMLQRHIDKGPIVAGALQDAWYFTHPEVSQQLVITRFKAEILDSKLLDGRTKVAKKLPYFTFEDIIANY